jgi:hypothetical protein
MLVLVLTRKYLQPQHNLLFLRNTILVDQKYTI